MKTNHTVPPLSSGSVADRKWVILLIINVVLWVVAWILPDPLGGYSELKLPSVLSVFILSLIAGLVMYGTKSRKLIIVGIVIGVVAIPCLTWWIVTVARNPSNAILVGCTYDYATNSNLPTVDINLSEKGEPTSKPGSSNSEGVYKFEGLKVGNYNIYAYKSGYKQMPPFDTELVKRPPSENSFDIYMVPIPEPTTKVLTIPTIAQQTIMKGDILVRISGAEGVSIETQTLKTEGLLLYLRIDNLGDTPQFFDLRALSIVGLTYLGQPVAQAWYDYAASSSIPTYLSPMSHLEPKGLVGSSIEGTAFFTFSGTTGLPLNVNTIHPYLEALPPWQPLPGPGLPFP